jgi:hypothetical protein
MKALCGIGVVVVSLLGNMALAQQSPVSIDIIKATLNSANILEITLDDVTTMLGRPTFVENDKAPGFLDFLGPQVMYHSMGLSFVFEGKKNIPTHEQRLTALEIYLSRTWDAKTGNFFEPFSGRITKGISANWKSQRTVNEFKSFPMHIITQDEHERRMKELFGSFYDRNAYPSYYTVSFELPTHSISFLHEVVAHFLEKVQVTGLKRKILK